MQQKLLLISMLIGIPLLLFIVVINSKTKEANFSVSKPTQIETAVITNSLPSPTPTPTPTPTPRPFTLTEMNNLYGPCVSLPVIFYHHISDLKTQAVKALTVDTNIFTSQMAYLKTKGYTTIGPESLINFFDKGIRLPKKSIMLTFDDGYEDLYTKVYPILRSNGFKAVSFLPTGLVNNIGYLNWNQVREMSSTGVVYFANHTWSHHSMAANDATDKTEINTAETQLASEGLDQNKIFAYPYGTVSTTAITELKTDNYNLAFTTKPGSIMCAKQRYALPRLRIGNSQLSSYGF